MGSGAYARDSGAYARDGNMCDPTNIILFFVVAIIKLQISNIYHLYPSFSVVGFLYVLGLQLISACFALINNFGSDFVRDIYSV